MRHSRRLIGLGLLILLAAAPARAADPPPPLDALGDPLPPYALSRLGTTRLRLEWSIVGVAYSGDGKVLVGSSNESGVALFDGVTGRKLRQPHSGEAYMCPVAASADGKRAAYAVRNGGVTVVETATGNQVGRVGPANVTRLLLSPDGKRVVTLQFRGGAQLWDVDSGKDLTPWRGGGSAAAFGRDGQTLFVGDDKRVRVWDVKTGKELRRLEGEARILAASADGRTLAARAKNAVRLWDPTTGDEKRTIAVPDDKLNIAQDETLVVSADGSTVALAGNGHLFAWDSATGKERFRRTDKKWYTTAALSPDGKTLAWGVMYNPTIHRWDLAADKDPAGAGHENHVQRVAFGPDGKSLTTGSNDGAVRLWTLSDPVTAGVVIPTGSGSEIVLGGRFGLSPDGKVLALPGADEEVCLRETATGKLVRTLAGAKGCYAFAFSPDGKLLAVGDGYYGGSPNPQGRVLLWEVESGRLVRKLEGHGNLVRSVAFSPDGKRLASGSDGVRVLEVATGKQVRRFRDVRDHIDALAFTKDGTKLVAGGEAAVVLDLTTGEEVHRVGAEHSWVGGVALSPDDRLLATAGRDGLVRLWDFATGDEVAQLKGHEGRVNAAAFSPDGRVLATGGVDTTVLFWDVPAAVKGRGALAKARLTKDDLARLWDDLGKADAKVGHAAVWALADEPAAAVALITERLPKAAGGGGDVAKLIGQLDDDVFDKREEASKALDKLGRAAVPALREALRRDPSAEAKKRLEALLAKHDERGLLRSEGDDLRLARAVHVLELVGTPEARKVLEGLRDGAPSRAADDARGALERLDRRTGGKR